jgi:ferric-dicitrate binding protein FerR (iron transport regulator)
MTTDRLRYLLDRCTAQLASAEERAELRQGLLAAHDAEQIDMLVGQHLHVNAPTSIDAAQSATILESILAADTRLETFDSAVAGHVVHRVHFLKRGWWKYAAAIVLICGAVAYLWNTQQQEKPALSKTSVPAPVENDVAPGGNKALLTLADGQTIVLDSAANGALAHDGGAEIRKTADGQIVYAAGAAAAREPVVYNTMSTPRGGQYQVTLPDGTNVWLNAASSITYPTVFAGPSRTVKITGEAYFEVTKDPAKPFIVETRAESIRVLGTHFNVNAYADEGPVKTSLLEGSVQVAGKVLRPGQAYTDGKVIATNVEQDVAWTQGVFDFHRVPLAQAMRQLSKWYAVDVVYEKGVPDIVFGGSMGRDLNLSQVLSFLEKAGVHFRLTDNRQLIVTK